MFFYLFTQISQLLTFATYAPLTLSAYLSPFSLGSFQTFCEEAVDMRVLPPHKDAILYNHRTTLQMRKINTDATLGPVQTCHSDSPQCALFPFWSTPCLGLCFAFGTGITFCRMTLPWGPFRASSRPGSDHTLLVGTPWSQLSGPLSTSHQEARNIGLVMLVSSRFLRLHVTILPYLID